MISLLVNVLMLALCSVSSIGAFIASIELGDRYARKDHWVEWPGRKKCFASLFVCHCIGTLSFVTINIRFDLQVNILGIECISIATYITCFIVSISYPAKRTLEQIKKLRK